MKSPPRTSSLSAPPGSARPKSPGGSPGSATRRFSRWRRPNSPRWDMWAGMWNPWSATWSGTDGQRRSHGRAGGCQGKSLAHRRRADAGSVAAQGRSRSGGNCRRRRPGSGQPIRRCGFVHTGETAQDAARPGKLDSRYVDLDVADRSMPMVEIFSNVGMEEMGFNFKDMLGSPDAQEHPPPQDQGA
jgi:hypothetical protein